MSASGTGRWACGPPAALLPFLILLSYLYGALVRVHRVLYSSGLLRRKRLPRPVVSVGNLTVGGGGKTPLVIWLAAALEARGLKPAILSRGYGRKGTRAALVDPRQPWQVAGDEPFLMATRLGHVPVAVAADRFEAGKLVLGEHDVDLFILDDGFQHRGLARDLDVVVIDNLRRFGNGRLLPAGLLREPITRLSEADHLVVTRASGPDEGFRAYLESYTSARISWSDYRVTGLVPADVRGASGEAVDPKGPFFGFCGIAGPEGFRRSLNDHGLDVTDLMIFPDHYVYRETDVETIITNALDSGASALVTTEKDAVRIPLEKLSLPCFALAVEIEIHGPEEALLEPVMKIIKPAPDNFEGF